MKTPSLSQTLALALALAGPASLSAAARPSLAAQRAAVLARLPASAPRRLSDLYRVFEGALGEGLGVPVRASVVRLWGISWQLVRDARFPKAEVHLKTFRAQGLRFDKADFIFRDLVVDRRALWKGRLELKDVRESQTQLVFTLRSLDQKLASSDGTEPGIRADLEAQRLVLTGKGTFLGLACSTVETCRLVWNPAARTLSLVPVERIFGGRKVPHWLWGLAKGMVPSAPVLDFGASWIPFNIRQVHVGWDEVDLSTDW